MSMPHFASCRQTWSVALSVMACALAVSCDDAAKPHQTAPAITSANEASFTIGAEGAFTLTATDSPAAITFSVVGSLPAGVAFDPSTNDIAPSATQAFTLTVHQPPSFISADSANFAPRREPSFTVAAAGYPDGDAIFFGLLGTLPEGLSFADHADGTATFAGTPLWPDASYDLILTACNGVSPAAQQDFTLTTWQSPDITTRILTIPRYSDDPVNMFFDITNNHSSPVVLDFEDETGAQAGSVTVLPQETTRLSFARESLGPAPSFRDTCSCLSGVGGGKFGRV